MPDLSRGLTLGEGLLLVFVVGAAAFLVKQIVMAVLDLRAAAKTQRQLEYRVMELSLQRQADAERFAAREARWTARRREFAETVRGLKETLAEVHALFLAYRMGEQIAPDLEPLQRDLSSFGHLIDNDDIDDGDTIPQG